MSQTNIDLVNIAKKIKLPLVGVFTKDELKDIKKQDGNYILNLQSSEDGNGSHWTCFIVEGDKTYYFDSFGFPAPKEFGKWNKEKYFWSDKQIQNLYSTVCGYYCIAFLIYMNNRPRLSEFQKFLDMFSDDPKKNRTILAEFLKPY
jgi:hypothetical protein